MSSPVFILQYHYLLADWFLIPFMTTHGNYPRVPGNFIKLLELAKVSELWLHSFHLKNPIVTSSYPREVWAYVQLSGNIMLLYGVPSKPKWRKLGLAVSMHLHRKLPRVRKSRIKVTT
jgi:hypothetical protein